MKFMVDEMEADKVRRLLEAADVNYIPIEDRKRVPKLGINPENCNRAASKLGVAFIWNNTEEGGEYWEEVFNKLRKYARMGEK